MSLSLTQRNIAANALGLGWSALLQLAFVPVFIRLLGVESYGLVGFYLTLLAVGQIFDFGISPITNRELARFSAIANSERDARDLVRTLEAGYWGTGLAVAVLLWILAPLIAERWLSADTLGPEQIKRAVRMMAILFFLQWPVTFYHGGLMGLQRQVVYNVQKIGGVSLAVVGTAVTLSVYDSSAETFFACQIVAAALQTALLAWTLWKSLPPSRHAPRVIASALVRTRTFAIGTSGLALSSLAFNQIDKLIVSRATSLVTVAHYSLAVSIASAVFILSNAVYYALLPRFTALVESGGRTALVRLLHVGGQSVAVLVFPVGTTIALFSPEIVTAWTQDVVLARYVAPLTAVLVVGTMSSGIINLLNALQLAFGWTDIGIRIYVVLSVLMIPGALFAARQFGAIGVAAVWSIACITYVLICIPLLSKRLRAVGGSAWLLRDFAFPALAAFLPVLVARRMLPDGLRPAAALSSLVVVFLIATLASGLMASDLRRGAMQLIRARAF